LSDLAYHAALPELTERFSLGRRHKASPREHALERHVACVLDEKMESLVLRPTSDAMPQMDTSFPQAERVTCHKDAILDPAIHALNSTVLEYFENKVVGRRHVGDMHCSTFRILT
jgi:negative regulator of sigma E activity